MTADELKIILEKHADWLCGRDSGVRADLTSADLTSADLYGANLTSADLTSADLTSADLTSADLYGANLTSANLTRAYLTGANLTSANLTRANLTGADLTGTCLSKNLLALSRKFAAECPPTKRGGRIVYRTSKSVHVGDTKYTPGHTYIAHVLSWSVETECHPGIYAASLRWMKENYRNDRLVKCYVRDGDWTITAKGAIRCERLRVLGYVSESAE